MQQRTTTWRQLLKLHGSEFLTWLEKNELRLKVFNKLAEDLEYYVKMSLMPNSYGEDLNVRSFIECIPSIYSNCDDPQTYQQEFAVLTYAHVHFLERYRRT